MAGQHRLPRREALAAGALAGATGVLALACRDDGSKDGPPPRAAATGGATQEAAKQPKRGSTLIVDSGEPQPSALLYFFSITNQYLRWGIWDNLVIHGPDNRPQPALAEVYEMRPDFTGVQIRLRPGVEFHSGRRLTAEDVRFSIEAFRADTISSPLKKAGQEIAEIKVADERTLEIAFAGRRPYFDDYFCMLPIVDKDTLSQHVQMKTLVGTGPFKFISYAPQQGYVLERNPNYWDTGKPYLDRIQGKIYSDEEARTLALQTGELLHTNQVSYAMVKKLKGIKDVTVADGGVQGSFYMGLVVTHPVLRDARVRRALTLAIDRQRVAREWAEGVIEPQALPWPKDAAAHVAEDEALARYDPEQAKALLKQAGAENLTLPLDVGQGREDLAQFAQDDWRRVGVNAQINLSELATWTDRIRLRRMEAVWGSANTAGGDAMHPATFFGLSQVVGVPNTSGYEPPHYKALLDKLVEADPRSPQGRDLIRQWNRLYLVDEPWLVPLAPSTLFHAMRRQVIAPPPGKGPARRPPTAEIWIDA